MEAVYLNVSSSLFFVLYLWCYQSMSRHAQYPYCQEDSSHKTYTFHVFWTRKDGATQPMDCWNSSGIVITYFVTYFNVVFIGYLEYKGFVTKLLSSNSCFEFILDWPRVGVGPMRQFVLKWIRTVVGPPPAYQEPWQPRPPLLGVASACSLTHFCARRL